MLKTNPVGQLIAAYLGKHDMDVIVEPRGDRAEEVVVRENPDLVLLDIMLPGKDGMTLCRDLRARWEGLSSCSPHWTAI
jgi:two-component system response regulator RstA